MGEEEELQSESNVANANTNTNEDYSFPALRFDVSPHRTYHFHRQFITPSNPNNFHKAVKWYATPSLTLLYLLLPFSIPNLSSASVLGHLTVPASSPLPRTTLSASSRRKSPLRNLHSDLTISNLVIMYN